MDYRLVIILLGVLCISVLDSPSAFALNDKPFVMPDSPVWGIKLFIENIKETFTFDQIEKTRLVAHHAIERQLEIENCSSCKREHLIQAETIRQEKSFYVQKKVQDMSDLDIPNPFQDILIFMKHTGELNEVRILTSEFHDLYDIENDNQRLEKSKEIDSRVNTLEVVQKYCTHQIESIKLYNKPSPYSELQKICPALNNIPIPQATAIIGDA